jgi:tripartite-type tricarboxylate transporter receptor subunit TctC
LPLKPDSWDPAGFHTFIADEVERWKKVAKSADIRGK